MNVYIFTYNGNYGGGMAIVIAYTTQEAYNLLAEYLKPYDIEIYTDMDHCEVEQRLETQYWKPTVIASHFYTE